MCESWPWAAQNLGWGNPPRQGILSPRSVKPWPQDRPDPRARLRRARRKGNQGTQDSPAKGSFWTPPRRRTRDSDSAACLPLRFSAARRTPPGRGRRNDDARAGFGVGIGLVMTQRYPQPGTDIGQPGGTDIPDLPSDLHRAHEWMPDGRQAVGGTATAQYVAVEWRIVRREEAHIAQPLLNPGPDLSESRCRRDVRPRQAVHVREDKFPGHRPDQMIDAVNDASL